MARLSILGTSVLELIRSLPTDRRVLPPTATTRWLGSAQSLRARGLVLGHLPLPQPGRLHEHQEIEPVYACVRV